MSSDRTRPPVTLAGGLAIAVLALVSLAYAAFGVQWLARPEQMARPLGILLTNGDATSDARAVYGGMELGLALFLVHCNLAPSRRATGLAAATLTLLGLGSSRLIGILLAAGVVTAGTTQLLATDLAGTLICASVWIAYHRSAPPLLPRRD
jgi:hypothetical protein